MNIFILVPASTGIGPSATEKLFVSTLIIESKIVYGCNYISYIEQT